MFYVKEIETPVILHSGKKSIKSSYLFSENQLPDYVQVFEGNDLTNLTGTIRYADNLWNELTKEYVKIHGDGGSCVIGAGIEVLYITKRTPKLRGLKKIMLFRQPGCCQGSINWEGERLEKVLHYLKDNGITNARYNYGFMD